MADLIAGYKRIVENRRYEDFRSLKQQFQHYHTKEIIFEGYQLATAGAGVVIDGSQATIGTQPTAEEVVFLATEADDTNQDLKNVWIVYQDDTGEIKDVIEHILNDTANTSVPAPLGAEDKIDTVASVAGDTCTMTVLNPGVNAYAGMYLVGMSGDQKGVANLIISNTAANPTVITLTDTPNANLAADVVSIQTYPCTDFFRLREMYSEVEPLDTKQIVLGTHDVGVVYGAIGCDARYMANSGFFTQPTATCRSFLGRIKASHSIDSTVTELTGASVFVTFTPKEAHSNGGVADVTVELIFSDFVNWEPCIELAPATDVIVKISNVEGGKLDNMFVEVHYLEVYK